MSNQDPRVESLYRRALEARRELGAYLRKRGAGFPIADILPGETKGWAAALLGQAAASWLSTLWADARDLELEVPAPPTGALATVGPALVWVDQLLSALRDKKKPTKRNRGKKTAALLFAVLEDDHELMKKSRVELADFLKRNPGTISRAFRDPVYGPKLRALYAENGATLPVSDYQQTREPQPDAGEFED
jgi:hypothetical protein